MEFARYLLPWRDTSWGTRKGAVAWLHKPSPRRRTKKKLRVSNLQKWVKSRVDAVYKGPFN